jgi:hypothetical protein
VGYATYTARIALAPGHAAEQVFTLPLKIADLARPSGRVLRQTQQSISGKVETQYFGEVRIWSVTLAPVQVRDAAIIYEFLRSTEDGQSFTFDPYGSPNAPVQALSVVRDDDGYTDNSFVREGRGGITDWVTLGFQVREI